MAREVLMRVGLSQYLQPVDVGEGIESIRDCLRLTIAQNFGGSAYAADEIIKRIDATENGIQTYPFVLGEYPIIKKMGTGGSASVYLIHGKGEIPAGPAIAKSLEAEKWRKEFMKEIALIKDMHGNPSLRGRVPEFLTEGDIEGKPYYVTKYVDGCDANLILQALDGNPPPAALVDAFARYVAHTLMVLHEELEVIHRDVKPHNLIVCADGSVALIDFGASGSFSGKTQTGHFTGTPGYMNLIDAQNEVHIPQRDVLAFGVTLYELYLGSTLENLRSEGYAARPSARLFEEAALGQFLAKMTDPNALERPSMRAVRDFFGARAGIAEEQRDQPLRLPPLPTLKQDPYAPTYASPLDLLNALKMGYPGEAAVRKGAALTKTIEFFNPDKKRLSRREVLGLIAASGLGVYFALSRKEEELAPSLPSAPVVSAKPPEPEAPKVIPLDQGGQMKIRPAEDGIAGDIVLFAGEQQELVLPASTGVHAYRNHDGNSQWCGSVHYVDRDFFKQVFSFTDKDLDALSINGSTAVYSYLSEEEARVYFLRIGTFFRDRNGVVKFFHANEAEPLRLLPVIKHIDGGGSLLRMQADASFAKYILSQPLNEKWETRAGKEFHAPAHASSKQPSEFIESLRTMGQNLSIQVKKTMEAAAQKTVQKE